MKQITLPLFVLALATVPALADTNLAALRNEAQLLRTESATVKSLLRQKALDANTIQEKVAATRASVQRIQELVNTIDGQQPAWINSAAPIWSEVKTRAEILGVIHERKQELANPDGITKQRKLLLAHVDGVLDRADKLAQRLTELERKAVAKP